MVPLTNSLHIAVNHKFSIHITEVKEKTEVETDELQLGNWPNSLVCTDIYQCGARRDTELCPSVTYIHTKICCCAKLGLI